MMIVRPDDLGEVGYCHRGAREWAARHNLEWSEFVRFGLPVEKFEAIDDAMAQRLAAHVRGKNGQ